mmetsp:Transcript_17463/g.48242  ORF Transcript_17463/g.48242 Transcript_17463/m.48242 type:complete len:239 (+) Transcript_17463:757-1473(+)
MDAAARRSSPPRRAVRPPPTHAAYARRSAPSTPWRCRPAGRSTRGCRHRSSTTATAVMARRCRYCSPCGCQASIRRPLNIYAAPPNAHSLDPAHLWEGQAGGPVAKPPGKLPPPGAPPQSTGRAKRPASYAWAVQTRAAPPNSGVLVPPGPVRARKQGRAPSATPEWGHSLCRPALRTAERWPPNSPTGSWAPRGERGRAPAHCCRCPRLHTRPARGFPRARTTLFCPRTSRRSCTAS